MKVHSVESLAALDGEGLRYAVFLNGCPLRCVYCHNPDTWNPCAGQEKTTQELFAKIRRYLPYFKAGQGGVTFSGGEPLLQAEEINALATLLRTEHIGYTLDTCGCVPLSAAVQTAVKNADLVICDLTFPEEDSFLRYTGGALQTVLAFLDYLYRIRQRTWVRTVIVPGINDTTAWMDRYLEILRPFAAVIEKYQLLGYHTMGAFKYEKLGIPNPLGDKPAMPPQQLQVLQEYVNRAMPCKKLN